MLNQQYAHYLEQNTCAMYKAGEKAAANRKQWSTESRAAAVKFCNEGRSLRKAARFHGVPHETLQEGCRDGRHQGVTP